MSKSDKPRATLLGPNQTVAQNRRARFDYELDKPIEAGLQLTGSEVKSLREGKCSLGESYVGEKHGDLYLLGATIEEFVKAGKYFNHEPRRPRKLLLHGRERDRLIGAVQREGYTIIALRLYFNARNLAKLEIALGRGKKLHDKRATEKARDWGREKNRLLKR